MRVILLALTSSFIGLLWGCSGEIESLETNVKELNLELADTFMIEVTAAPLESSLDAMTWESLDSSIANVDDFGQVTALQAGTTTIVVSAGELQTQVTVNVTAQEQPNSPDEPGETDPAPVVVSVQQVDEIDVPFGSSLDEVIALLPAAATIVDEFDATYEVPLDWVVYNYVGDNPQFAPARYVASGLFEIPDGLAPGDIRTQVDTFVNLGIGLADISFPEEFRVSLGTSLEDALVLLDDTALITDSLGNQTRVDVTWLAPTDYDADVINGIYEFVGTLELPEGVSASEALPAEITVPVKIVAAGDILYGISAPDIEEINVRYGTTLADALNQLPNQITIIDNEDTEHTIAVNWVIYDFIGDDPRLAPGRFIAEGFYQLPERFRYGALPRTLETYINLAAPNTE